MVNVGLVQGSKAQAVPLIVGVDTVYVHTNIKKLDVRLEFDERETEIYEYNEVQYDKDEYIELVSSQLGTLQNEDLNNKVAITEIFEMLI